MGALAIYDTRHHLENDSHTTETKKTSNSLNMFEKPIIYGNEKITFIYEDIWDFKDFASNSKDSPVLDFSLVDIKEDRENIKRLMYLLLVNGNGRNGSLYSVATIKSYFSNGYLNIFEYAKSKNISVKDFFESNKSIYNYAHEIKNHKINTLFNILQFLKNTKSSLTQINYKEDKNLIAYMANTINTYNSNKLQTPVIPSRILLDSIKERWLQIDEIIKYLPNFILFFEQILLDENFAMPDKAKRKSKWSNEVKRFKLTHFFSKYKVNSKMKIDKFISKIQGTCSHLIHAYSGMRKQEVFSLKNDCYKELDVEGSVCRLFGITTKIEGKASKDYWVTSKEIKKVVKVLNEINSVIAKYHQVKTGDLPLFVGTSMIKNKCDIGKIVPKYSFHSDEELEINENILKITYEDKKNIESVNFNCNYKDIEIGNVWKFTTHQYRRSLAVYSIQSGLVTLGALQNQMKHLFREMTLYYGNGASFAKKLFDVPKNHIATDIEKIKPEIETLAYIKEVLYSDEPLHGTYGKFVENNMKPNNNENFNFFFINNRDKILSLFKNGEIAYKETALGGCISTEACDYALTRSIVACGGCDSSIIKKSKLDNVINKQKEFIEFLDKDSIEYRTEMRDLEELEKQRKQFFRE